MSALNLVLISYRKLTKYRVLKLAYNLITFGVKLFELKPILTKYFLFSMYTYCAFHVLAQPNFQRYNFYFMPDQAQTHIEDFNVLRRTLRQNFN